MSRLVHGPASTAHPLRARDDGWSASQFSCLEPLWQRERLERDGGNPSSGAYGIPQALPGSKMASAGAGDHEETHGWY